MTRYRLGIRVAMIVLVILSGRLLATDEAANPRESFKLSPGRNELRELPRAVRHSYEVSLKEGDFLRATVAPDGIDVIVAISGPDGPQGVDVDVVRGMKGWEPGSLLATTSGVHRIEVRARDAEAVPANYTLETETVRRATEQDRARIQAERILAKGRWHHTLHKREEILKAAEVLESGIEAWQQVPDPYWEAFTVLAAGEAHMAVGEVPAARDLFELGLEQFQTHGPRVKVGESLMLLAGTYSKEGDYRRAISLLEEALATYEEVGHHGGRGNVLQSMAVAYNELGELGREAELARLSLEAFRASGNRQGIANAVMNQGAFAYHRGLYEEALERLGEAVLLQRALRCTSAEGIAHTNTGSVLAAIGEPRVAIASFKEAGEIFEQLGDRGGEALIHQKVGEAQAQLGETDAALASVARSLELHRAGENRRSEAVVRLRLAELQAAHGRADEAVEHGAAALAFFRDKDRGREASARVALATALRTKGRLAESKEHAEEGVRAADFVGNPRLQASARLERARVSSAAGDLAAARNDLEKAIEIAESVRGRLRSPQFLMSYAGTIRPLYEEYVDVLLALDEREPKGAMARIAFEASERARARGLLDLLSESPGSAPSDASARGLRERESALRDRVAYLLDRQLRVADAKGSEKEALRREIDAATLEYERLQSEMRAAGAGFAKVATVEAVQELLDDDTVLLTYAFGAERAVVWAVDRRRFEMHALRAQDGIQADVRRAYALLAGSLGSAQGREELERLLASLGRELLGPVRGFVAGRRVAVAADGALHLLPFGALPDPDEPTARLVERHEIVRLPSASTLAALRAHRRDPQTIPKKVLVLADPVFDRNDERVRGGRAAAKVEPSPSADVPFQVVLRDVAAGAQTFPRLPFTRREGLRILQLAGPAGGRAAVDFDASIQTLLDPALADYGIVHVATHGFLHDERPEFSGVVLSLVDKDGRDQRGFFTARDVLGLRLSAELVVLSGCRTALGRDVRGEGLVGLARAFFHAGAPRVLASSWAVDEVATAELMSSLYASLFEGKRRPAEALRTAQIEHIRSARWSHPYFWAAFELQGDWR